MSENPVSMVGRVVNILQVFDGSSASLSLANISETAALPKSSTFRILQQLVEFRLVEKVGHQYRLGLGIFELGSLVPHRNSLVEKARPHLQELSVAGRFAAHLAILDGTEVVYLEKVGGKFAGFLPSRVGGRFVAHQTGVGKAILAGSGELLIEQYFDSVFRGEMAEKSRVSLQTELQKTLESGYAVEHGQAVPGVSCVAAPVIHRGVAIAAISVSGPTQYLEVDRLRNSVRMSATIISRSLRNSYAPIALAG